MFMTRLEKCQILKEKGYKYDKDSGKITSHKNTEIIAKTSEGYINLYNWSPRFSVLGHHFAYYMTYGNVEFEMLDHINRDKTDNRICNLRLSNAQNNSLNTNPKGAYFNKQRNNWYSRICIKDKDIFLGYFKTEEEARQAYLSAKSIYHQL